MQDEKSTTWNSKYNATSNSAILKATMLLS